MYNHDDDDDDDGDDERLPNLEGRGAMGGQLLQQLLSLCKHTVSHLEEGDAWGGQLLREELQLAPQDQGTAQLLVRHLKGALACITAHGFTVTILPLFAGAE